MKIFFDGGCRPNPGPIEITVVVGGVVYYRQDIGHGSNDDAEWLALIYALEVAAEVGATDVQLLGDSATVINRANSASYRSESMTNYRARFAALRSSFLRVRVRHIKRSQNLAGIYMAKLHSGR